MPKYLSFVVPSSLFEMNFFCGFAPNKQCRIFCKTYTVPILFIMLISGNDFRTSNFPVELAQEWDCHWSRYDDVADEALASCTLLLGKQRCFVVTPGCDWYIIFWKTPCRMQCCDRYQMNSTSTVFWYIELCPIHTSVVIGLVSESYLLH